MGLFNRLYSESSVDNSVEDYGLTVARLALTPVLSGLAAVGGVLVVAMVPALLSGDILTPGVAHKAPAFEDIFSLTSNQLGIIISAVFGLSPALLIGALQDACQKYRSNLQSTSAGQGKS